MMMGLFEQIHVLTLINAVIPLIMAPVAREGDPIKPALSARMDEWIARQHTLIKVAQDYQHRDDHRIPINSYVLLYTPPILSGCPTNDEAYSSLVTEPLGIFKHCREPP